MNMYCYCKFAFANRPVVKWAAIALAPIAVILGFAGVLLHDCEPWLKRALLSGLSLRCALILVIGFVILVALSGWVFRASRRNRRKFAPADDSGAAILEFALAFPFALMIVLIMIQTSLLMGGNVIVHYSAYCGARSAIVQIPKGFTDPVEGPNVMVEPESSGKYLGIRESVLWPLLPISASSPELYESYTGDLAEGLAEFFRRRGTDAPGWLDDRWGRKLTYADEQTIVEVSTPEDGLKYAPFEDITVRVEHTFYLAVPYAARVFASLDSDDGVELSFAPGEYGTVIRAACTLTNEGDRDFIGDELIDPYPMTIETDG